MTPLLTAANISIPGRLSATDIVAEAGQLIAIIGPNGGGKTSLLRALARIDDSRGHVHINGEELAAAGPNRRSRLVGFLPASRDVAWPIRVRDLIRLGGDPDEERIDVLLEQLELTGLSDRRVDHLSTGERARALIARVLSAKPCLLVLDEPLSNLDPYWVTQLFELLRNETRAAHSTALVSLHDVTMAERFDRLLVVNGGSIAYDGMPSNFLKSPDFEAIFRVKF
jgi:iron complex transport system ATP-binding protein